MLLALATASAYAQLEITSSPNVVGSGARALGMGGAFIAVADDATAASWNPGGLTQLERPELSLVYSYKWLRESFNSGIHPEFDGSNQGVSFNDINYFSYVYPVPQTLGGRNFVLSLSYQRKYDFDRDLNFPITTRLAAGGVLADSLTHIDYSQRGALGTLSPALGFEVTDRLSVGVVMNIWDQSLLPDNEWKVRRTYRNRLNLLGIGSGLSAWSKLVIAEDYNNFSGTNFTLGALWRATERLSVGLVYHTKFTADVEYSRYTYTVSRGGPSATPSRQERNLEYTFPSAIGLGLAYRFPNDKLTLSFDVTRREWNQFVIDDPQNPNVFLRRRSGVTGQAVSQSQVDPTYTVRVGGEYVFVDPKKPKQDFLPSLRAGFFYDPEPSGGRKDFLNGLTTKGDGDPDDYLGVTLGAGMLIKDRVNIDAAYTYRWGTGVRKDSLGQPHTDEDVDQHLFYFSTVIYF